MPRFYSLFVATMLVCVSTLYGQGLEIAGKVVARGVRAEPLPGATVRVKATNVGTTTDVNGAFKISLKELTRATLIVSYVGYKSREIEVESSVGDLRVVLEEDVLKTSEVVSTGFASSVKRENLANSVATISAKELVAAPAQTLDQALSGKFAGVNVSQNTGAPGGGISVTLRGVSTIEGATQPLYVVDGVIVNNAANQSGIDFVSKAAAAGSDNPQGQPVNRIADINPNEIQNIEVLKGASAAALYGSKATNGVVIITTKRGVPGRTRVEINQQVGFNSLLRKIGTRKFPDTTEVFKKYGHAGVVLYNQDPGRFIDYEDEMYGENGFISETNVSASGGNEQTQFFASGISRIENGIVKKTGYKKYGGRVNINHKFSDDLKVSAFANLIRSESDRSITGNDNTNTTLGFSLAFTPSFYDIRPQNGVYPDHIFNPSNPFQTRDLLQNNEVVNRSIGSLQLDWNLVRTEAHSLDFITKAGVDFYSQENRVYSPPDLQFERNATQPGASLIGETRSTNANLYLNLVHSYTTESNISFKTSTGVQHERQDLNNVLNEARGIIVTQTNIDQAASINAYQNILKQRELGFYFQEEVNLFDEIFLTGGVRADASSVNGDPDKFYFFPKASGSVRLSKYPFWEGLASTINEFKVRVAYGETGNLAPPNAKFTPLVPRNIGGLGGLIPGTRKGDPTIKPERTKELEAGFDATLFDGRASVEFSYFRKNISDLLLIPSLAPSSGFTDRYINGGKMRTTGVEISLVVAPFSGDDFNWTSRVNFFKTTSEVTELNVPPFNLGGFATFLGTYRIETGWSPTSIVGAEMEPIPGTNQMRHKKLGDETPDFQMSFANTLTFGDFELGFLWEWKQGGDVINLGKLITDLGGTSKDYDELGQFTLVRRSTGVRDSVVTMKKGDGRLAVLGTETAPYIEDGTYLKLRELHLTYTLPQDFVNRLFGGSLSHVRVGVAARNLLVFTGYDGYDPEVSQFGNVAIGRSVDTLPFPSSRSYYFNISLGL
jgi:TonB-linked SusC/RagA family outer membrane protein